jgi:predicted unusual protein kinase regulating ubiquinone biosynthesis (AarF/ABC1/UbiB family)
MEYVPHIKLTEAYTDKIKNKKLASEIMGLFINQFIFNGVVHADPHLGNLALLPDRSRFVMYDFGHIIEFDVKTRNYMKLFVFELMNENIDNIIKIIKKVPDLITVVDEEQLIKYIKEYVKYIKTIDITVLKDLTQNDKSNLPFKFSGKIYELIRTFGIIEGICLEIDPTFSYYEVFNKYINRFFNDDDFIVMKSSMDMDKVIDMF